LEALNDQILNGYDDCKTPADSGKMVNEFHYKRICEMLKDHGGEMIHGNPNAHKDMNLKFNVILNPKRDSTMMKEEIFGPILPVLTYKYLDEAIDYIIEEQLKPLVVHFFGTTNCAN
jgi:aldehyde dehydrogenase (NAD+)